MPPWLLEVDAIAFSSPVLGLLVEGGDADIADIAFERVLHRADAHDVALHRHIEGLRVLAQDGDGDRRVDRAAHQIDGLIERHALDRLAIDLADEIVGLDAGALGRRIVDRRDDLDEAVFHGDLDAEPAEFAAGLHLHVLVGFGIHVARMRIERGQHAVDRRIDQLGVVDRLDIIGAHALENVAEQIELAIGVRADRFGRRREGLQPEHGSRR